MIYYYRIMIQNFKLISFVKSLTYMENFKTTINKYGNNQRWVLKNKASLNQLWLPDHKILFCPNLSKSVLKSQKGSYHRISFNFWGIVPFVATHLEGQYVIFSKWLLIGYFRFDYIGLGDCPGGLGDWPCRVRAQNRGQKQEKSYCETSQILINNFVESLLVDTQPFKLYINLKPLGIYS